MKKLALGTTLLAAAFVSSSAFGQTLLEENFDTDVSANWNVNLGPTDFVADFTFDYSTIGIPEAPNSTGTTATTGVKMYANEIFNTFGGGSISPIGLDLSAEANYVMTYDFWHNFHGPAPGGGSGTTQLSYAGILTAGTSAQYAGTADGIYFAETLDGGSGADWRVYASARQYSLQATDTLNGTAVYEASVGGTDSTARNASNVYYASDPAFPGSTIPAAQTTIVAGIDPLVDQTGTAQPGTTAFAWAQGKIIKDGDIVTWYVNDVLIATVDTTACEFDAGCSFEDPLNPGTFINGTPTAGNNILLGHSDTNSGSSSDALFSTLTFSLYDNIKVEVYSAAIPGDLDGDGFVGLDDLDIILNHWNQTVTVGDPLMGDITGTGGNPDGFVGLDDLDVLLNNWNAGTPPASSAVPEPATLALLSMGGLAMLRRR